MIRYRLHWTKHPEKDEAWYEKQKTRMSEDEVARELDINYTFSVSGRVFSSFRAERHASSTQIQPSRAYPVYRIWDFGGTNCTLYAQIDSSGRRRVLHERVLGPGSGTTEQAQVALSESKALFGGCEFVDICDPAGIHPQDADAKPQVDYLHDLGLYPEYHYILDHSTRERKVRAREMIEQDLQKTPGGEEAFKLYAPDTGDGGCPILKKAFLGGYRFKKSLNGEILDKVEEKHPYEDVMDCLIYFYLQTQHYSNLSEADMQVAYSDDYNEFLGI